MHKIATRAVSSLSEDYWDKQAPSSYPSHPAQNYSSKLGHRTTQSKVKPSLPEEKDMVKLNSKKDTNTTQKKTEQD